MKQLSETHANRPDKWIIRRKAINEFESEHKVFEHFEEVRAEHKSGVARSTIREDHQDRIDRGLSLDQPVRIRIFISGAERALSPEQVAPYFLNLPDHLRASGTVLDDIDELFANPCEFIAMECFGTEGLVGDEKADKPPNETDPPNHFYYFFRKMGESGNRAGSGSGGSHGLGRTVYYFLSKIHTIFGFSNRQHEDPSRQGVLFGQSFLKFHNLGNERFVNVGCFGIDGEHSGQPTLPYTSNDLLSKFADDFGLKRQVGFTPDRTLDTGLSVVIPFAKSLTGEDMAFHSITEYGGMIVEGKLEVEIDAPDIGLLSINAESIWTILENKVDDPEWNDTKQLLELLQHGKNMPRSQWVELPRLESGQKLSEIELSEDLKNQLAASLAAGQVVVARVPVELCHGKPAQITESEFRIVLQSTGEEKKIATAYFRDALRISGMDSTSQISGIRSVFIADGAGNRTLADMLTCAEGPAHTKWSRNETLEKQRLRDVDNWLRVCKGFAKTFVEHVKGSQRENDFTTLAEFFPDPSWSGNGGTGSDDKTRGQGGEIRKKKPEPGEGEGGGGGPRPFEIGVFENGDLLKVFGNGKPVPNNTFTLSLVYKIGDGSSFKKDNMNLCPLGRLQFVQDGVKIVKQDESQITVRIKKDKWSLGIKNLDKNRLPRIRVEV